MHVLFIDAFTVNAKGWFVYIISHGCLTAQDKAFFIPWGSFFIAACLQHEKGGKIAIYLAAKLSASPHGIKAYNWSNKVEPWMEFCSLGYTVLIYLSTNCLGIDVQQALRRCYGHSMISHDQFKGTSGGPRHCTDLGCPSISYHSLLDDPGLSVYLDPYMSP